MSNAIDRTRKIPVMTSLFAGVLVTALSAAPGIAVAADGSAPMQVAQAQQKAAPKQAQQPADPTERQLAELQKRLAIPPAQQPQFDAFAQVVRQNSKEMDALSQPDQQKTARNAVEDLRSSAQMAQAEADGLKRLQQPLEALYASLTDQQKRTADQLLSNAGDNQAPAQAQPRKR